jgi:hypothetical protein
MGSWTESQLTLPPGFVPTEYMLCVRGLLCGQVSITSFSQCQHECYVAPQDMRVHCHETGDMLAPETERSYDSHSTHATAHPPPNVGVRAQIHTHSWPSTQLQPVSVNQHFQTWDCHLRKRKAADPSSVPILCTDLMN